jgi:hypothetical protein
LAFKINKSLDLDVGMCPFYLEYAREVDANGIGITPFKMHRFEFTHSHPLSLEYEL